MNMMNEMNILGMKIYMFRTVPLSIIRSFSLYTQQCCIVIQFCRLLANRIMMKYHSKNKFEKLVHLVGFVIRMKSTNV